MKQLLYLFLIILIYSFNTSGLTSEIQNIGIQDSNVTSLGTWTSGYCEDVYIVGNFAYILKGSVFEILDITNPTIPISVGQCILKANAHFIQVIVSGNYAYVMSDQGIKVIHIIDINDPLVPVEVSNYALEYNVLGFIDVRDDYIFVVNTVWSEVNHSSLQVIDVSDPQNPKAIGESDYFDGIAIDISISNNMAYILTDDWDIGKNRLYKFDISIPTNPQIIANYDMGVFGAQELFISDEYAFISTYHDSSELLYLFNINDFTIQNSISNYDFGNCKSIEEVYKRDDYLYIAITQWDTTDSRQLSLRILDISNPSNPFETGSYNKLLTGYWVESMKVSDNYAFITLGPDGLNIINIGDVSNPSFAGYYHTGGGVDNFAVDDNIMYVGNGQFGGISVLDCKQPKNLKMVNYIPTEIMEAIITVSGNYVYMAGPTLNYGPSHFSIFSISNGSELEEIGSYEINQWIANFQIANNFAYLILGNGELLILDITHPENIEEISRTPIFYYGSAIYISDNIAYVGVSWGWGFSFAYVSRVDITNPSNPEIIDTLFIADGYTNKIIVSNNFGYIIGSWSDWEGWHGGKWFYIIDYANPSDPQVVDSSQRDIRDIDIKDDLAYIITDEGLEIFDIADPYNLKKIGFYDIEEAKNVAVNEDIVYVSRPSVLYSLKSDFTTKILHETETISTFLLYQNYPNPFNPSTRISWQLPISNIATLKIFNILGKEVATLVNEYKPAGKYETEFNAANLPSGVYFYQLKAGEFLQTKKMILLK